MPLDDKGYFWKSQETCNHKPQLTREANGNLVCPLCNKVFEYGPTQV